MAWGGDRLLDRINSPPFTWTPQKWVEPGFNPLYTFHMRTSNQVQSAFYTRIQPASEGGLNSYLSEFEALEKMADRGRMWTYAKIALLLKVWSENSIQRQLQGAPCYQRGNCSQFLRLTLINPQQSSPSTVSFTCCSITLTFPPPNPNQP